MIHELDIIVKNQPKKPILLGHSWGGVLGAEYAKRKQENIHGLIFMSTGLSASQWTQWNIELEELGLEDASAEGLFLTPIELEDGRVILEESMKSFSSETFDSLFQSYLSGYNLLEDLGQIKIPIMNIYGEKDLRFSKNITTSFKKFNNAITNLEINNAGHFPFLEKDNKRRIIRSIIEYFK